MTPVAIPRYILVLVLAWVAIRSDAMAEETKISILLQRSPAPPNSVLYIHAPSLHQLMADANLPAALGPSIEEIWAVSDMDIMRLIPRWEAGYAKMARSFTAEELAKALGGYVDTIAETSVAWTPNQSYLVPIGDAGLGFLRPANRSLLGEWLDKTRHNTPPAFLAAQAEQPEQYLSFLWAVNLKDSFSPVTLTNRLASFEGLGASPTSEEIADIVASVQGVSIIVGRRTLADCKMEIDFAKSPQALLPIAKTLLDQILKRNGTEAPEVLKWQPKVEGNKLTFRGFISEDSLSGMISLFSISSHADVVSDATSASHNAATHDTASESPAEPAWTPSKKYFDGVVGVVARVRKYHATTTGSRAKWSEIQARRIDELGTLNVDPDLIAYGADVSSVLRTNALTMQQVNIKAGQTKAAQSLQQDYTGGYSGGRGAYGGYYGSTSWSYDPNTTQDYQRVTSEQARGSAYEDYRTSMSTIEKITGDVRREMTQKYGVQF